LGIYRIVPLDRNKKELEEKGQNIHEIANNCKTISIERTLPLSIKTKTLIEFLSQPFCKFSDSIR